MLLNHKIFGSGEPLVILHGLFGSLDNWLTHAKKLSEYYQVILVDQRNHGHSDWSDEFNYDLLSNDLEELLEYLRIEKIILLGHSMGGKTAINFTQKYPEKISKLIVVDIGVKGYPMHHDQILKGLNSIDLEIVNSRSEATKTLSKFIDSEGVKQFLLKNLYWIEKGKLAWRINIPILEKNMPDILTELDNTEVFEQTLFIRGALSHYILDDDIENLESIFNDFQLVTIENAGHWVHAEQPETFIETVLSFCLR
jgi:pimeloyl-ACP methyl ester carboxylesterase